MRFLQKLSILNSFQTNAFFLPLKKVQKKNTGLKKDNNQICVMTPDYYRESQ